MFCPNCGNELEKDSVFCTACGEFIKSDVQTPTVTSDTQAPTVVPTVQPVTQSDRSADRSVPVEPSDSAMPVQYYTVPAHAVVQQPPSPQKPPEKGGVKRWVIILIILCVIAAAGTVVGVVLFKNAGDSSSQTANNDSVSSKVASSGGSSSDISSDNTVSGSRPSADDPSDEASSNDQNKLTQDGLVGEWDFSLTLQEIILQVPELADAFGDFETDAAFLMVMQFNQDKTVQIMCHKDNYLAAYEEMCDDYVAYLRNGGLYEVYADQGMTREDVDEYLSDMGMTVDLFIDILEESLRSEDVTEDMEINEEGYVLLTDEEYLTRYALEDGKITFVRDDDITKETYFTFEYKDGAITVIEGDYADGVMAGKILRKKS